MHDVRLPQVGMATQDGTVVRWLKAAGTSRVLVGDRVHYLDHAAFEATQVDIPETEAAPVAAQPLSAARSETAGTATAEPRQARSMRVEQANGVTKLSLDDLVDQLLLQHLVFKDGFGESRSIVSRL